MAYRCSPCVPGCVVLGPGGVTILNSFALSHQAPTRRMEDRSQTEAAEAGAVFEAGAERPCATSLHLPTPPCSFSFLYLLPILRIIGVG